jgi:dTDP-D-glucose 4,6-dehydratase
MILAIGGAGLSASVFRLDCTQGGALNFDKSTYAGDLEAVALFDGKPSHIIVQVDTRGNALLNHSLAEGVRS